MEEISLKKLVRDNDYFFETLNYYTNITKEILNLIFCNKSRFFFNERMNRIKAFLLNNVFGYSIYEIAIEYGVCGQTISLYCTYIKGILKHILKFKNKEVYSLLKKQ